MSRIISADQENDREDVICQLREYEDPIATNIRSDKRMLNLLLDEAIETIKAPANCIAYLEGSIAEGFGNGTSDIDFVLIDTGEQRYPIMPALFYSHGFRVEVRIRSIAEMRRQITKLRAAVEQGEDAIIQLAEEEIDRCQRFRNGLGVRRVEDLAALQEELPRADLNEAVSIWFSAQAFRSFGFATAMFVLQQSRNMRSWARSALTEAAKSWLALQGETYLAKKWLVHQLNRLESDCDDSDIQMIIRAIRSLDSNSRDDIDDEAFFSGVREFFSLIQLEDRVFGTDDLSVAWVNGVTTWEIGNRAHIVKNRADLFSLSDIAGRVWRNMSRNMTIADLLTRNEKDGIDRQLAGDLLAAFQRMGLIDFSLAGGKRLMSKREAVQAPTQNQPVVTLSGLPFFDTDKSHIKLAPIPANRFASCGLDLSYANMNIENAREDALGAIESEHWGVLERSLRRILRDACIVLLTSFGISPVPAVEEVVSAVNDLDGLDPELKQRILAFDDELVVADRARALACLKVVDDLVSEIRSFTYSDIFPSCFMSNKAWRETLYIGYDWTRLGAHLDAEFPLEQMRDLIAFNNSK